MAWLIGYCVVSYLFMLAVAVGISRHDREWAKSHKDDLGTMVMVAPVVVPMFVGWVVTTLIGSLIVGPDWKE